jgi:hypothetical protein
VARRPRRRRRVRPQRNVHPRPGELAGVQRADDHWRAGHFGPAGLRDLSARRHRSVAQR